MTILFVIASFSLILVNDNFLSLAFLLNCCCNSCSGYGWASNLQFAVVNSQHLVKCYGLACACASAQSFYLNDIAFSYLVLFTTCSNNCVHMAPPYQLLARFGGLSTLLPLCAAYFYNISSRLLFVNSIFQEIADFFSHAIASAPGPMWQATLKDSGCASTSKSGKASFTSTIHPSITSLSFAV